MLTVGKLFQSRIDIKSMELVAILLIFVAGVNGVPQNLQNVALNTTGLPLLNGTFLNNLTLLPDDALLNITNEELAMTNIITTINVVERNLPFNGLRMLFPVLMRTIDQQCMLDLYNQQNLSSMIPTQQLWSGENRTVIQGTFIVTALLCSSKTDVVLEFLFENLRNLNIIARAFIDDPQLNDFAFRNMLTCANRFAFDNGVLDPDVYNFSSELRNESEEDACLDWIETTKMWFVGTKNFITEEMSRTCTVRVVNEAELFLVRNVVLSQAELTPIQRRNERTNLVRDARQILQKFLACAAREPTRRRARILATPSLLRF